MSQDLRIMESQELNKEHFQERVLVELKDNWINESRLAKKLDQLLDAKTLNAKWDIMEDNKAQLRAFELAMNLYWIKTQKSLNINILNMVPKDQELKY